MERRTYERMMREIRAIHLALTGEELRDDDVRAGESGAPPSEHELTARFAELATEARAIPSVALELWALGLDDDAALDAPPPPPSEQDGAPAQSGVHADPGHQFLSAADIE